MKSLNWVFILIFLLIQCGSSTSMQRDSIQSKSDVSEKITKITIAILMTQIEDGLEKKYSEMTRNFIEEEFTGYNEFQVVDRVGIDKSLKEMSLAQTGLTDSQISKIGQFVGAKQIVTSHLTRESGFWILSGRLIDVETAKVIKTASGRVSSPEKLDGAAKGFARRLTNRIK